ncbi:Myb/SANT-like domain [Sesbania bispinosa]|nr:Myb/SANT-like domain [Sesbania bispinosa]
MNKEKGQGGDSSQGPRETWRWYEEMDYLLITTMVDEARKGLRVDGSWVSKAYGNMVNILRAYGLPKLTQQHIKNRQKTLKDKWRKEHDMFNGLSGFALSPMTKKFEAEVEV